MHFYLFFSIQNSYVIILSGLVNQKWRNVFFWEEKGPRAGRQGGEDGVHAEGHLGLCGQLRQLHPLRSKASTQSGEHQLEDQPEPAEVMHIRKLVLSYIITQEEFSFFQKI